jgi:hypothetical protein
VKWWQEKGKAFFEAFPGVKSVKAYAAQFGLGGNLLEVWLELENYAALDRMDEDLTANPQKYAAWAETPDLFENGPARIMGDWPESSWLPPSE